MLFLNQWKRTFDIYTNMITVISPLNCMITYSVTKDLTFADKPRCICRLTKMANKMSFYDNLLFSYIIYFTHKTDKLYNVGL